MKSKISLVWVLCWLLCSQALFAQSTQLTNKEFWITAPSVETVKAEVSKGFNFAETFHEKDPIYLALLLNASNDVVEYLCSQPGFDPNRLIKNGQSYLFTTITKNQLQLTEFLLKKGANLNLVDDNGHTAVTWAAHSGWLTVDMMELLSQYNLNLKATYPTLNGANLLLLCVATDRELNKIKYLKSKGISIQSTDAYGRNAFYYACQVVDRDILQYLVAEGVKPTNDAFYALAKSSFQIIEPIKKYEFLVETFKLKPNAQSANEDLPLIHLLCQKDNYVSIISYLMDQGLKVDVKDDKGRTALWYAVQGNSLDVVELLWSHINVLDDMSNQEISVFEMALLNGTSDVVKFLISKGFNVTTKDANGSNYAHKLVQYAGMQTISRPNINKYEDIASKLTLLSEHGLSLKDVNADGNNILALAVLQNDFRLLAALSGMDVNPNQRNNEGLAPMHLAVRQSNAKQLIQYLLTIGADKKMTTPSGQTMVDLLKQHPTLKDDTSFFEQFLKED